MNRSSNLLTAGELKSVLGDQKLRLLDCSWFLPSSNRNPKQEYLDNHIAGAQFFDINKICDQHSPLPHMLPSADAFANDVGGLGINNEHLIVTYDTHGVFSSARVWWMFRVFGHTQVKVLNGGLPSWLESGGPTMTGNEEVQSGRFESHLNSAAVANLKQVAENTKSKDAVLIDARPSGRFTGELPEPRVELPSGHIDGSLSLPFDELLENGKLKPREQLLSTFKNLGITGKENVITSCGSGVTAAILTLALAECGYGIQRLYDGAWTEWASQRQADASAEPAT